MLSFYEQKTRQCEAKIISLNQEAFRGAAPAQSDPDHLKKLVKLTIKTTQTEVWRLILNLHVNAN